ncbi:hypothetical protein [Mucisphaera calidilacus]|uniref:Sigma-70, region 4 n=1 Tax=Mucisphaera calidilacus TaxID=2527982 RepID=A0A518C0L8_9BACT|nr:hypothetical protein [Mucisphaera calidilacus]QDU72773.1 Sigma-70, region 4 [Mucisphaera calidilacus]
MSATTVERATEKQLHARVSQRNHADRILARAAYLPRHEQLLLDQIYRHGMTITDTARLLDKPPRTVQRRLRNLLNRLNSDLFAFVATQLDLLPPDVRPTAKSVALHGHSLRKTARQTGISLHRVREHMGVVKALARL